MSGLRLLAVGLSIGLVAGGCTKSPPESPHWAKYRIGAYQFEIERIGEFSTSVDFHFKEEGGERTGFVEIVADAVTVRIEDGKLTVNNKAKGEVEPDDLIKVPLDGKVSINGKPVP